MLRSRQEILRLVKNVMLSSINIVLSLRLNQRLSLVSRKIQMIFSKSGNVNSVIMKIWSALKMKRNQMKRLSTIWWRLQLKFKTKKSWARKISLLSLLWINLDPCVCQHQFKVNFNWKEIKLKKWKNSWSLVMVLTSSSKAKSKSLMSVECNACKLQSINRLSILVMELQIEKLAWSVSMIKLLS